MTGTATLDLVALMEQATRSVVRVETLPAYVVPSEAESLTAWLNGRARPVSSIHTDDYLSRVAQAVSRGVTWERLRVIDSPPTSYQQWEIIGYLESQVVGEQIIVAPRNRLPDVRGEDAWIIDDHVVVQHYDLAGHFLRRELIADPEAAEHVRYVAELVAAAGEPLNVYLADAGADARAS